MQEQWVTISARSWLKSWLEQWVAPENSGWVSNLVGLLAYLALLCLSALFLIWLERKISARIQNRMGPMLTGPEGLVNGSMWTGGLLQTVADAIKLLLKELIIPQHVDRLGFILAPIIIFTVCLCGFVVIPFGPAFGLLNINIGLLYVVSMASITVLSILMAGWSSNNKYSLMGGLRSASQMLSYEVPLIFALLGPVVLSESLSMQDIILAQQEFGVWFAVPACLGFGVYFVSSIAEVNRPPFDIPEAESELVAGYVSEYSGMMFAMFFLAEFCNMFLVCSVAATVFLGGWSVPFVPVPEEFSLGFTLLGVAVFFLKVYALILVMMWIRWTFPRVRPDHLMNFGWKFLLPLALVNLFFCTLLASLKELGHYHWSYSWMIGLIALGLMYTVLSRTRWTDESEGDKHASY